MPMNDLESTLEMAKWLKNKEAADSFTKEADQAMSGYLDHGSWAPDDDRLLDSQDWIRNQDYHQHLDDKANKYSKRINDLAEANVKKQLGISETPIEMSSNANSRGPSPRMTIPSPNGMASEIKSNIPSMSEYKPSTSTADLLKSLRNATAAGDLIGMGASATTKSNPWLYGAAVALTPETANEGEDEIMQKMRNRALLESHASSGLSGAISKLSPDQFKRIMGIAKGEDESQGYSAKQKQQIINALQRMKNK